MHQFLPGRKESTPPEFLELRRRFAERSSRHRRSYAGDDEIGVKRNNNLSERYDIFIGDSLSVNVHGYTAVCRPARF